MATRDIALLLLCVGAGVALLNAVYLYLSWRRGRFVSPIPLLGGLCLGVGAVLLPDRPPYAWAAALLDYGTVSLLFALPAIAREAWATCRLNLLEEYVGRQGQVTVRLQLFRRSVFTLVWDIERPPGEFGLVGMGRGGTWQREAGSLVLHDGAEQATFGRVVVQGVEGWVCSAGFPDTESTAGLALQGVPLLRSGQ